MRAMVDSHVVILATRRERSSDPEHLRSKSRDARALIQKITDLHLSAIAWLEVERGVRRDERVAVDSVLDFVRILPVDAPVIFRAGDLVATHQRNEAVCPACLCSKAVKACRVCKLKAANGPRLGDAIILATAEIHRSVEALFSDDAGLHHLARGLRADRQQIVKHIPSANGPLFEHGARP